ncbi:MAG TPA: pantoate--beta-alanine ligase [Chloroflexota bacterium]
MREIEEPATLRAAVLEARCAGKAVGLVPTMGFLHAGHLRLAEAARTENDFVVMSIFINPTQFGPSEDLDRYPRDLERDRSLAETAGVDVLFVPSMETMYPGGPGEQTIWVEPGDLARHLEGEFRPGHFRGVATVVAKLFNIVGPDRAYFGQKDAQQAVIIRRMAKDLAYPTSICIVPTVREEDGLAFSSRNAYLSPEERAQAAALSRALRHGQSLVDAGEKDARRIERDVRERIRVEAPLARIDYVRVADLDSVSPIDGDIGRDSLIALAVYFGATRLIDNAVLHTVDGGLLSN